MLDIYTNRHDWMNIVRVLWEQELCIYTSGYVLCLRIGVMETKIVENWSVTCDAVWRSIITNNNTDHRIIRVDGSADHRICNFGYLSNYLF